MSEVIFSNPAPNYFRPYVAWTLNDRVTRVGLARQLRSFASCGFGGVMIQPWGGTPYAFMSRSWLDCVALAVELAAQHGMGVWLWDDWLFPSGFAGGELGKEDRHKSKKLRVLVDLTLEAGETAEVSIPPRFLAAGVVGINKYNNPAGPVRAIKPADKDFIRCRVAKRSRLIVVGWEMVSGMRHTVRSHSLYLKKDPKSWIYTCDDMDAWSCDLLNPETTRAYLGLIHEKYWLRLKEHFGKTVHGFWYDEPHLPGIFPWTPGLTEIFQTRKGYDLTPFLVPMFLKRSNMGYDHFDDPVGLITDEKLKGVLADYHDVWTSLLAENFYGVIQEWCHEHGVLSIGHQGADETLNTLLSNGGVFFKNMDRVDMPGVDVIWGQVAPGRFDDFPRLAGSRASLAGKPFAVSESFAASGHGTYLDEMRFLAEHQIIRGINHFLIEIASYNPKKSFFYHPPEVNPSINPMIRHYGKWLHQRMEHVSTVLSQGRSASKTCLYVPVQNYYRQAPQPLTDRIADLARELTYHQREFDYAWDNDIAGMTVRKGMIVSAGGQVYGEILIPAGANCGPEILKVLQKLKRWGARVVIIAPAENSLRKLATVVCAIGEVVGQLQPSGCPIEFAPEGLPISVRSRRLDDQTWVTFLLNESKETQTLTIKVQPGWGIREEDLTTESTENTEVDSAGQFAKAASCRLPQVPKRQDAASTDSRLVFAPGESKMIYAVPSSDCRFHANPRPQVGHDVALTDWKLELPDGKSLRLRAHLRPDTGGTGVSPVWKQGIATGTVAPHSDQKIPGNSKPLPSWHELGFGTYSGFLSYTTRFRWDGTTTEAILDLGEVRYAATVWLDQREVGDAVFTPFRLPLTGLKKGWHTLRVNVLNTLANSICGTEERERELEKKGAFIGTYAPLYLPLDRQKIPSGLIGPVVLRPIKTTDEGTAP